MNVVPVCSTCDSTEVKADSYSVWVPSKQDYEHCSDHGNWVCEDCGGECSVTWNPHIEVPLETIEQALKDDTRYIDSFAMNYVRRHREQLVEDIGDDVDATLNDHFQRGLEPDFYDFVVRSEADDSVDYYYEVERVPAEYCALVEHKLETIFALGEPQPSH